MIALVNAVAMRMRRAPTPYLGEKMARLPLRSRLCFVSDGLPAAGHSAHETIQAALAGGVGMIQYCAQGKSTREMVGECAEWVWACRRLGVPVLVRDRADVALAALADGEHLGPDDMPIAIARRLLGPGAIIGASCRDLSDAREAERQGASYAALGPLFVGDGPAERDPALAALRAAARTLTIPLCAIGAITADNARLLAPVPLSLVLVDAAIASADDPEAATRALVEVLARNREN